MSLRVLLVTEAYEGLGHVAPWHRLLETLHEHGHGHAVAMACPQASLARPLLEDTGARVLQAWWPSMHSSAIDEPSYCWEDLLWNLGYGSNRAVAACAKYWGKLLASEKPDVIVADYAPLAMSIAKSLDIPVIEAGGGFCVPPVLAGQPMWLPHIHQLNLRMERSQEWTARAEHRGSSIAQAFNRSLPVTNCLPEFDAIYQSASVRCVTSSPELDHYASWRANDVEYLGALALASLEADPDVSASQWASASDTGMKLLCYLKDSTPRLDELLAQLAASVDWQILIAGLSGSQVAQLCAPNAELPGHIYISEQALDFSRAIPLAEVFLTNGGIHSLSYALSQAKYCLLVPSQAEQASTAFLLKDHALIGIVGEVLHLQEQLLQIENAGHQTHADMQGGRAELQKPNVTAEAILLTFIEKLAC